MTCAKKRVECSIITRNNGYYYGTNDCERPQTHCPRRVGEGYEKCKSVCRQQGHAEEVALEKAVADGADLNGAIAYISGIDHFCKSCQQKLYVAGVRCLRFRE